MFVCQEEKTTDGNYLKTLQWSEFLFEERMEISQSYEGNKGRFLSSEISITSFSKMRPDETR